VTTYDHSDTGNAELFNSIYGKDLRYDSDTDRWLQWRSGKHRWKELDEGVQLQYAIKAAGERFSISESYAVSENNERAKKEFAFAVRSRDLGKLQNMLTLSRALPPIGNSKIKWDSFPHYLAVANGVVDLQTNTLRPGRRDDHITQGLNIPYDEKATCPRFIKFIKEITLDNEELATFIQQAIGYTLTGSTNEHVFFMLHGAGSNGKSVLVNILGELLEGFSRTVRFRAFEESTGDARRDLAELPGVRAVFASEGTELKSLDTSVIKQVTGGEPITTSRKYGHPFTYRPQFKLWLTTNKLPKVRDDSYGFWRRIIVIPFDATFEGSNRDNRLQEKLTKELPGILNWALQGAQRWYASNLNTPNSLIIKVMKYRNQEDEIANFISECTEKSPGTETLAIDLYTAYTFWSMASGIKPFANAAFGRRLGEIFPSHHTVKGKVYEGVKLLGDDAEE